ncbi:MAG: hypothetical protein D6743_17450 [Calditrichaeota bacterium]|nr:MAG: hypothetical protein D6743_17450 [Calditrichota bacterium]
MKPRGANWVPANMLTQLLGQQTEGIRTLGEILSRFTKEITGPRSDTGPLRSEFVPWPHEEHETWQKDLTVKLSQTDSAVETLAKHVSNAVPANTLFGIVVPQGESIRLLVQSLVPIVNAAKDMLGDLGASAVALDRFQKRLDTWKKDVEAKLSEADAFVETIKGQAQDAVPADQLVNLFLKYVEIMRLLAQTLTTVASVVKAKGMLDKPNTGPYLDLLWWGEAMFSHRTGRRFAELDTFSQLFWLPFELAERAPVEGPMGALESYLVERLSHLSRGGELKLDGEKPLRIWLAEAQKVVTGTEIDVSLGPALKEIVDQDAYLLPLSALMGGKLGSAADQEGFKEKIARHTGIPADTSLTAVQWATQVLRERLIDRLLRGEA